MSFQLTALSAAVQHNCHIADARYASDYTLCVYLLKMVEYYRWERGYPFSFNLPKEALGAWMTQREALWETLETASFQPLLINGKSFDPFATYEINQQLVPQGLVYSAGLGNGGQPHFFLAQLHSRSVLEQGSTLFISETEYARDFTAPPAMHLDNTLFVRRESLRRMLWERYSEWRWQPVDNPMGRAVQAYPFAEDVDAALALMAEAELAPVIGHEQGEYRASLTLGAAWGEWLAGCSRSRLELLLRAVRDHYADALVTLPQLLAQRTPANWHFYLANLRGWRKVSFPALIAAYQRWHVSGDWEELTLLVATAREHWQTVAQTALSLHAASTPEAELLAWLETQYL